MNTHFIKLVIKTVSSLMSDDSCLCPDQMSIFRLKCIINPLSFYFKLLTSSFTRVVHTSGFISCTICLCPSFKKKHLCIYFYFVRFQNELYYFKWVIYYFKTLQTLLSFHVECIRRQQVILKAQHLTVTLQAAVVWFLFFFCCISNYFNLSINIFGTIPSMSVIKWHNFYLFIYTGFYFLAGIFEQDFDITRNKKPNFL